MIWFLALLLVLSASPLVQCSNLTGFFMGSNPGTQYSLERRYKCADSVGPTLRGRSLTANALSQLLNVKTQKRAVTLMDQLAEVNGPDFGRLRNCAVDDKGRTLPMQFVLNGWVDAVAHGFMRQLLTPQSTTMTDADQNTYMHLAAMSADSHMVSEVHDLLTASQQDTVPLMDQRNALGQTPIDIANRQVINGKAATDLVQVFKDHYKTGKLIQESLAGRSMHSSTAVYVHCRACVCALR
eukprot:Lankesteria_metandrocarpae@DN7147_c0_g1_i2.p1